MTHKFKSVHTEAHLNLVADFLEQNGVDHPYATDWDKDNGKDEKGRTIHPLKTDALDLSSFDLQKWWEVDVAHVMSQRRLDKWQVELRQSYAEVENEKIREFLLGTFDEGKQRGLRKPQVSDLTGIRGRNPADKYVPVGECGARLKLKEAVCFAYEQQSYADHSFYVVPFEGTITDRMVAMKNLNALMKSWRTHNGWAGSGSDWTATMLKDVVVLECRSSISD